MEPSRRRRGKVLGQKCLGKSFRRVQSLFVHPLTASAHALPGRLPCHTSLLSPRSARSVPCFLPYRRRTARFLGAVPASSEASRAQPRAWRQPPTQCLGASWGRFGASCADGPSPTAPALPLPLKKWEKKKKKKNRPSSLLSLQTPRKSLSLSARSREHGARPAARIG